MREDLHNDVGSGVHFLPKPPRNQVRRMLPSDIDWAIGLAKQHYGDKFDAVSVRTWALARLSEPAMVFLRTDHAFGVAHLGERYNAPGHKQAYLTLLYAEPGNHGLEVVRIMDGLRQWGKGVGVSKFWFGDVTGHDMAKLAKVLGGRLAGHTYVVDLDGDPAAFG